MAYDNTNSGALFKNDRKETDSHPNYTGKININGVEFWLSAWVNEIQKGEKAGTKYISLKAKPVEDVQDHKPGQSSPQAEQYRASQNMQKNDELDDDIPF